MNNEKISKDKFILNWNTIVRGLCPRFNSNDIDRVCEFAYNFMLNENIHTQENILKERLILLNLKTIGMITDISQVIFIPAPVNVDIQIIKEIKEDGILYLRKKTKAINTEEVKHKVKIDKELLTGQYLNPKIKEEIEYCVTEIVATNINTQISLGNKVYLYLPIQKILEMPSLIVGADYNKESEINYVTFEIYSRCAYIKP